MSRRDLPQFLEGQLAEVGGEHIVSAGSVAIYQDIVFQAGQENHWASIRWAHRLSRALSAAERSGS